MPTAIVYHTDRDHFLSPIAQFPQDFLEVAKVELGEDSGPGEAFEKTNTIDRYWWENDGVEKTVPGGCRSTSVGDVVVIGEKAYRCKPVGWEVL